MYWNPHLLMVWAAVYLTWGLGNRPTWAGYRFTYLASLTWMGTAFLFNLAAGTNYGFLNHKPDKTTALDALGPWPAYLLVEMALGAVIWAAMTWPWTRNRGLPSGSSDPNSDASGKEHFNDQPA
ncbi:MAG: TIGR02206 family membrane protein, partial [Myxococcota bacterium]